MRQLKNLCRVAALALLLLAALGPWTFTSDGVPPAEWCAVPNILLENARCVRLVSGIEVLFSMLIMSIALIVQIAALLSAGRLVELARVFLVDLCLLVMLQPLFSTWRLLDGDDRQSHRLYNLIAWGLAALFAGAFLVVSSLSSGLSLAFWGNGLYVALAISMVTFELLPGKRKPGQG